MDDMKNWILLKSILNIIFFHPEPPRINGSGVPVEVSVVVNNALELHCMATGIPVPSLTWMKDGRPLLETDGVRVLRGGEVLRVASVQVRPAVT